MYKGCINIHKTLIYESGDQTLSNKTLYFQVIDFQKIRT